MSEYLATELLPMFWLYDSPPREKILFVIAKLSPLKLIKRKLLELFKDESWKIVFRAIMSFYESFISKNFKAFYKLYHKYVSFTFKKISKAFESFLLKSFF